jgi:protein-tyrosine phosphatase
MAEALLRRRFDERGVAANVGSAGFLGAGFAPMHETIITMAEDGIDVSGHQSRDVTPELISTVDLVLAMTRQHVIEVALLLPDHWQRIFQIRDFVRRADAVGRLAPGQSLDAWLAVVGAGRTRSGLLKGPLEDDIVDPVGGPRSGYEQTRRILDDLLTRFADLLA